MAKCRNPECRNGQTPGLIASGRGSVRGGELIGQKGATMRWGWVACLACNQNEGTRKAGAIYKHVNRTPEEIAQRAEQANQKTPYQPSVQGSLGKVRSTLTLNTPVASVPMVPNEQMTALTARIDKLLEQNGKLTEQVTELLNENRELRKQITQKGAA